MKREIGFSIYELQRRHGNLKAIEIALDIGADAVDFNLEDNECDYRNPESVYSKGEDLGYYTCGSEYVVEKGIIGLFAGSDCLTDCKAIINKG